MQVNAFACPSSRALVPTALDDAAARMGNALAAVAKAEIGGGLRASVAGSLAKRLFNPNHVERAAAAIVDAPLVAWFKQMYGHLRELIDPRLALFAATALSGPAHVPLKSPSVEG
ncbi:hypothetical protein H9P43_005542 [Blastocladiella emersonii ATCC 22665]|nr:hypothetical protein H9P43_005542 [Blastocladiella emersonii ATCC 22665]